MIGKCKLTLHKTVALILNNFIHWTPSNLLCCKTDKRLYSMDYLIISQMTDICPSEENRGMQVQGQD